MNGHDATNGNDHNTPAAPPRVAREFTCTACGYALRGLAIDALCPECGTPVLQSIGTAAKPTSGNAIASLVLGVVSVLGCSSYGVLSVICGPLAIFFSRRARRQIERGEVGGASNGLATAGLVCGIIGTVIGGLILTLILLVIVGAITRP
jgi:hypothetical protein